MKRSARAAARKSDRRQLLGPVLCVVCAAALLLAAAFGQPLLWRLTGVMTVGGETVSAVTFNYYYRDCYDSFRSAYGDYVDGYGLIDSAAGLDEQAYSEQLTWGDFFYDTALENAVRTETLRQAAIDAGYVLTDAQTRAVQDKLAELKSYAAQNGKSLRAFLRGFYGHAAGVKSYRDYLLRCALAESYCAQVLESFTFDEAALEAYFSENFPDAGDSYDYATVSFRRIVLAYDFASGGADGAYAAAEDSVQYARLTAQAAYDAYASGAQTQDAFCALAEKYSEVGSEVGGLWERAKKDDGQMEAAMAAWLFDDARSPGDVTLLEGEYGAYVLYFVSTDISARQAAALEGLRGESWQAWYDGLAAAAGHAERPAIKTHLYYAP